MMFSRARPTSTVGTRKSRGWRALFGNRDGSAVIEFAIVAPVFLTMLVGVMECAMMMFANIMLEGAVRDSARFGITGQATAGMTREARIQRMLDDSTFNLLDITVADVDLLVYPSFAAIGQPEPFNDNNPHNGKWDPGETYTDVNHNGRYDKDQGAPGAGEAGEIVLYKVRANWHTMTPLLSAFIGNDGVITLSASVAVRNEPWDTTG